MANPVIINPTMTLAGQTAAINASNTGLELVIDAVSFGRAHYDPTGDEVALVDTVGSHIPLAGGSRPTPFQLRMSAAWKENVGVVPIGEIGFWAGNTLVFVWSKANGEIASYKTDGVTYVLFCDLAFAQVPANSVTIVVDPSESAALAALTEHEGAANAHPQYLLRADVAKDSGPLMGLTHSVGSAAGALVLELDAPESVMTAYSKFQRFQFTALFANPGAVTVNIEGLGVKSVKRGGDAGLVELDPGDIKAGALYDLNYDGAVFQLGGGVGSGKAFERFSFTASVAQSQFNAEHTPGSIIVLRNGREIRNFTSAVDGSKITMGIPCNVDDSVEILSFKSFKVADTYTKAEITSLLTTASGLPVGSMLPMPKGIVPPGYLEIDASVQSIAVYPDLAAYLGTTFNTGGEGAGNFRLPESRGEFLRGWDHGRGVDAGRAIGSKQLDALQGHRHATLTLNGSATDNPAQAGGAQYTGNLVAGDPITDGVNGAPRTASETRPRNLAVMWCIKAWNAPINQGQVDVGELVKEVQKLKAAVPVGALVSFPVGTVPPGYLEADNSLFLDSIYPELAAFLDKKFNVAGDPAGSTRLPETRGEFLRGWDHGRGVDAGRAVGSWQKGTLATFDDSGGGASVDVARGKLDTIGADPILAPTDYTGSTLSYTTTGLLAVAAPVGGVTRPRNLAVMWCIKAWNAPVNQGSIDITALGAQVTQLTNTLANLFKTPTNVTASRAINTPYVNNTGLPIFVNVALASTAVNQTAVLTVDTLNIVGSSQPGSGLSLGVSTVVPPGSTYKIPAGNYTISSWTEMR